MTGPASRRSTRRLRSSTGKNVRRRHLASCPLHRPKTGPRTPRSSFQNLSVWAEKACLSQADARTRTGDPIITSDVLYQLSYVGGAPQVSAFPAARPESEEQGAARPLQAAPRGCGQAVTRARARASKFS
jgi:hypothetical protein